MKSVSPLLFSLMTLAYSVSAQAAACCGGSNAVPALITGDDQTLLTSSYSYSKIDTDVFANGVWQKRTGDDISQTFKIDAAHIFNDQFQYGFSVPIQYRNKSGAQGGDSSGLGDVSGQLGYEYLPDWDYNPWRPRGIGFISVTLPTGKSIYESTDGLDSRGRGFWALGIGTTLTKIWGNWDVNTTLEAHRAFDKSVNSGLINGTIKPGYGETFSLGSGYNSKKWRVGASLTWISEDAINVEGSLPSQGSPQSYATGTISSTYLFTDNWAGTVSYADQTLFGSPSNASLSKSIVLLAQKKWAR